ncbi:MAG: hypothetical protein HY904_10050 [Deltaproteobacteria bacterium]|nr:hypothetical protein [Deltaproteobacteria bacterium]
MLRVRLHPVLAAAVLTGCEALGLQALGVDRPVAYGDVLVQTQEGVEAFRGTREVASCAVNLPVLCRGSLEVGRRAWPPPEVQVGDPVPSDITDLRPLGSLRRVAGNLVIQQVPLAGALEGLEALGSVGGDLTVRDTAATGLAGLSALHEVGGRLNVASNPALRSTAGPDPATLASVAIQDAPALEAVDGFPSLRQVTGDLVITGTGARHLTAFAALERVGGTLRIENNPRLHLAEVLALYARVNRQPDLAAQISNGAEAFVDVTAGNVLVSRAVRSPLFVVEEDCAWIFDLREPLLTRLVRWDPAANAVVGELVARDLPSWPRANPPYPGGDGPPRVVFADNADGGRAAWWVESGSLVMNGDPVYIAPPDAGAGWVDNVEAVGGTLYIARQGVASQLVERVDLATASSSHVHATRGQLRQLRTDGTGLFYVTASEFVHLPLDGGPDRVLWSGPGPAQVADLDVADGRAAFASGEQDPDFQGTSWSVLALSTAAPAVPAQVDQHPARSSTNVAVFQGRIYWAVHASVLFADGSTPDVLVLREGAPGGDPELVARFPRLANDPGAEPMLLDVSCSLVALSQRRYSVVTASEQFEVSVALRDNCP